MDHSNENYVLHATAIVGSAISLFFCTTSMVAFFCLRPWSQTLVVKQQLTLAIGLTQLVLLTGIIAFRYSEGCKAVSVLLHFAASSCFSWSAVDALHLYFVHINRQHSMKRVSYYLAIGWGFPLIVLGASVGIGYTGRPNNSFSVSTRLALYRCWGTDHVVWTFIVPAIAIATGNVIILASIIKQLRQPSYDVCYRAVLEKRSTRYGLRTNALLLLGLCLGWIFGMLAFKEIHNVKYQLLFGLLNGLQGIFVFFFHCILSIDVSKKLIKYPFDAGTKHTCSHKEGCGISHADQSSKNKRASSHIHDSQSAARRKISSRTHGNENMPLISVGSPPSTSVANKKEQATEPLKKADVPVNQNSGRALGSPTETQVNQENRSKLPNQDVIANLPGTPEAGSNKRNNQRKNSPPILSNEILLEVERSRKSNSDPSLNEQGTQRPSTNCGLPGTSNKEEIKNDAKRIAPTAASKIENKSSSGRGSSLNELESLFSNPNISRPQRYSLGSTQSPGAKCGHYRKNSKEAMPPHSNVIPFSSTEAEETIL